MSQPRDNTRLGKELEELERTDPAVGEAARRLDETVDRILYRASTGIPKRRFHKSTPEQPARTYTEEV